MKNVAHLFPPISVLPAVIGLLAVSLCLGSRAEALSCMIPSRGGDAPGLDDEATRRMLSYRPDNPGGWVARTELIQEYRKRVEAGELDEADVPEYARRISGEFWFPVLPTAFANTGVAPFAPGDMYDQLFRASNPMSLRSYYDEISYGFLEMRGDVLQWQVVSENDTEYEGVGNPDFEDYLEEAFELHDPNVDFGLFDNDGPDQLPNSGDDDGVVDVVVLMQPEPGRECTGIPNNNNIQSHQSYYSLWDGDPFETDDERWGGGNITIDKYVVVGGASCDGGMTEIGVLAHELGHALGIMDLNDTDANVTGGSEGIGWWGLMGSGTWLDDQPSMPAHMSAFSKARLGWLNVLNLQSGEDNLCLPPIETNNVAVRLWKYGATTSEYFLVENRQAIGFDQNLPGEGLVIYHVDEQRYADLYDLNRVNADETFKAVDVECADASANGGTDADDLDTMDNRGDADDVYCSGSVQSTFSPFTTPSSEANSGTPSGVTIDVTDSCSGPKGYVCASFDVGVATPVDVCINDCDSDNCNEIATCYEWWGSPDIYVDNDGDGDSDIPSWGVENKLYTRVTNTGTDPAVATLGRVYLAWSAMGLVWPDDATHALGFTGFPVLDPGESDEDYVIFEYPELLDQNGHYCVGVVLDQTYDSPLSAGTHLTNNIAQVNHQVLVERGSGGNPARGGSSCGSVLFDTWVRIYDGANPDQNSVACEVRVGTHPNYDDAVIPPGWSYSIDPGTGPFIVSPTEPDSIYVSLWSASASQGEMAHLPLTLWNLDDDAPMGGLVIDAHVDCTNPAIIENLQAFWIPPAGDVIDGPNVLVQWDHTTVDVEGRGETVLYYLVHRSMNGGPYTFVDKVAIDDLPGQPGFQLLDHIPNADCPNATWSYIVRAVDFTGAWGDPSLPFALDCPATPVVAETPPAAVATGLLAVEPNPISYSGDIVFSLAHEGQVEISVFNARGERVRKLSEENRGEGTHRTSWDGRGDDGVRLPSGVYFVRAVLPGGVVDSQKITLMR